MKPREEEKDQSKVVKYSSWRPIARSPKARKVHGPPLPTRANRACPPKPRGCGELYVEAGEFRKCKCLRREDEKRAQRDAALAQGPA